jgi:hypothetical protein
MSAMRMMIDIQLQCLRKGGRFPKNTNDYSSRVQVAQSPNFLGKKLDRKKQMESHSEGDPMFCRYVSSEAWTHLWRGAKGHVHHPQQNGNELPLFKLNQSRTPESLIIN